MEQAQVIDLIQGVVWKMLVLSMPILIVTMVVGLVISIVQAVTQIQESTITFVPKIIAAFGVILLTSGWMIGQMVDYTQTMIRDMAVIARKH